MDLQEGLASEAYTSYQAALTALVGADIARMSDPTSLSPEQHALLGVVASRLFEPTELQHLHGLQEPVMGKRAFEAAQVLALATVVFGTVSGPAWMHKPKVRFNDKSPATVLADGTVEQSVLIEYLIQALEGYVF